MVHTGGSNRCCRSRQLFLAILLAAFAAPASFAQTDATPLDPTDSGSAPADDDGRSRRLGDALTVDPGQEWSPGQPVTDRSLELQRKLDLGQRALSEGNYLAPFDASALNYFQQALSIDGTNAAADAGLAALAQALLGQAERLRLAGDPVAARTLLQRIRDFRPEETGVDSLLSRLNADARVAGLLASATEAEAAGRTLVPEDDSALAFYREALTLAPDNAVALAGVRQLVLQAIEGLRQQLSDGEVAAALAGLGTLDTALAPLGDSAGLQDLLASAREELQTARDAQWAARLTQVDDWIGDDQLDQAREGLTQLVRAGYPDDLGPRLALIERRELLLSYVAGSSFRDDLNGGGQGPLMVVVPAGTLEMGSPSSEEDRSPREGPQIPVRLAEPFALAETEVSVAEFAAFVAATGYRTTVESGGQTSIYDDTNGGFSNSSDATWQDDFLGRAAAGTLPVTHVSWDDAMAYAQWLAASTGLNYRLPSEAEFEYAQRAGSTTPYPWGRGSPPEVLENLTGSRDEFNSWSWPVAFSRYGDGHFGPAPVGSFPANAMGLKDLGGNLLEWVADCHLDTLEDMPRDGRAVRLRPCSLRSLRGGGWAVSPAMGRSASRASATAQRASALIGFRVARDL
ncbi:MAG: formylglycine-generating enzyme family protein [Pseudomonadota bacterium]